MQDKTTDESNLLRDSGADSNNYKLQRGKFKHTILITIRVSHRYDIFANDFTPHDTQYGIRKNWGYQL